MMIKRKGIERRRYPRIEKQFPLQVVANGYDFSTATLNVSCLGAYCHINKFVPPFTKVAIKMTLPLMTPHRQGDRNVECNGVIVRSEDGQRGGFNIAIYFNRIKDSQRRKISRYLCKFLPKGSPA